MPDPRKKHLLLAAQPRWSILRKQNVTVDACGWLRLAEQGAGRPLVNPEGSFGGLALPTGMDFDSGGGVYFADTAACSVRQWRACVEDPEPLPCLGTCGPAVRQFQAPHGLAINARGDLLVADTGNRRIQVFSVKGLALRAVWTRPEWEPFDVVATCDCRTLVSDREGNRIHLFDSRGCWRRSWDVRRPTHIALDKEERLYVVEEGATKVSTFDLEGKLLEQVERVDEVVNRFCPLPDFLIVAAAKFGIQLGPPPAIFESEGQVWLGPLDSLEYRCLWHRVEIEANVPAGGTIRVDTFTSEAEKSAEEIAGLAEIRWSTGLTDSRVADGAWDCLIRSPRGRYLWLRLRLQGEGPSSPVIRRIRVDYPRITSLEYLPAAYQETEESADFLHRFLSIFDRSRGRGEELLDRFAAYLDPRSAPAAFLPWLASWIGLALDSHWPERKRRELLLRAPELYRLRGTPEGLRRHVEIYLGYAPRILEHFRLRRWIFTGSSRVGDGVLYGKAIAARLQLDENSRIGEFQLLDTGDPALDAFSEYAHRFTMVVTASRLNALQKRTVERIVEQAKPAHTLARVVEGDPRFIVGCQAFVGVDTVVSRYPSGLREGEQHLDRDAVLGPSEEERQRPSWRLGGSARIGGGTVLD